MPLRTFAARLLVFVAFLAEPAFGGTYTGCFVVPSTKECTTVFSAGINVYFGTAQLFGPGNVLLSTTTAMTVDVPPGPNIAGQIAADSTIPSYVAAHIGSFIGHTDLAELAAFTLPGDITGLAALFTDLGLTVNPVSVPNPDLALVTALTTQSVPFTVSGDTGFFLFGGGSLVFQYVTASPNIIAALGSLGSPLMVGSGMGPFTLNGVSYDFEGVTNVNIWERDFQLTETTTTPEPGSWTLIGAGLALALCTRRRHPARNRISNSTERT